MHFETWFSHQRSSSSVATWDLRAYSAQLLSFFSLLPCHSRHDGAVRYSQWLESVRRIERAPPRNSAARANVLAVSWLGSWRVGIHLSYRVVESTFCCMIEFCLHPMAQTLPISVSLACRRYTTSERLYDGALPLGRCDMLCCRIGTAERAILAGRRSSRLHHAATAPQQRRSVAALFRRGALCRRGMPHRPVRHRGSTPP